MYSAFHRLEEGGDIASFAGSETGGKPRIYYRLTEQGKATYASKCLEWQATSRVVGAFIAPPPEPDKKRKE